MTAEALHGLLNPTLRAAMLRFARLHLQPEEEAEDAVQDTLVALCESAVRVTEAQDVRRYVFGVLKNKVTDRLRCKYRNQARFETPVEDDVLDKALFDGNGHWVEANAPACWNTPEEHLRTDQFFVVLDACVNHLPSKVARVFSMKEFLECEAPEICQTLSLTKADYWQCMSRARKQLQLCLNTQWFGKEEV